MLLTQQSIEGEQGRIMGGRDAQRGFIFQSIIAMIECLDRDDWDEVKVEPDTALDKVDIQLYCDGKIQSAIQVKSSINKFGLPKVKGWLDELEKDAPDAEEVLLYLVGDSFAEDCEKYIGQNSDKIKKISFSYLKDICMGKIYSYVVKVCTGEDVRIKNLDQIEANLFTGIHGNSIVQEKLTRDAFEEVICSVLAVRLYDRLMSAFANERKGHPSICMMNPDPNLFPKGLPEIKSDNRSAVMNQKSPRAIKDIILDSWKNVDKWHILLVGNGGIGKTVAMLTLPEEEWFRQYRIPVIYVPLQRLDAHEGRLNEYLREKFGADYDRIIEHANRNPDGKPRLLLLLDGFNEIPDKYKGTAEKYIREWMGRDGVQIITTSRLGFALENSFSKIQLQTLPKRTVKSFLMSAGILKEHLPNKKDPIWKVINVPLMLTMYTRINKVREVADSSPVASILDWKKSDNATHIIWNYMQMELYRCIDKEDTSHSPMQYATAILLVAPYVCCQMSYKMKFYIDQEELQSLIREALSFYDKRQDIVSQQFLNFRKKYNRFSRENVLQAELVEEYARILVDNIALFQEQENRDDKGVLVYAYSLMHQNFRDALAAFFISLCLPRTSDSSEKTLLLDYADHYVKNCIAEFLSDRELIGIWDKHREEEPEDGRITWILMDIIGRQRNYDYREVNFSRIDLTKTNIHRLLSRRLDICPLPEKAEFFKDTILSSKCFLPEGHTSSVNALSYSPDGRQLASGSSDNTVRVWNLESGNSIALKGHLGNVTSVSFSMNGRYVISGSDDKTVRVWDLERQNNRVFNHLNSVNSVAISSEGRYLASGLNDGTVCVWDLENGTSSLRKGHLSSVTSIAFSPDGMWLVSASIDSTVQLWSLKNETSSVINRHSGALNCVSFSSDGRQLAIGSSDHTVRILNLESGISRIIGSHLREVTSIAFSPDGRHLASGSLDGTLRVWNLESGICQIIESTIYSFNSVSYSPDGRQLAGGLNTGTVSVWDLESEYCSILEGYACEVNGVSYSSDGRRIASCSADGTVRIWDLKIGTYRILKDSLSWLTSVLFSPNGRWIACGSNDRKVRVWNLENGTRWILKGRSGFFCRISFSSDGKWLASNSSDDSILVWNLEKGRRTTLKGHKGPVFSLAFNPSGSRLELASSSYDGTVRVWNLEERSNYTLESNYNRSTCLAFSSDGKLLAGGTEDGTIRIWNLDKGSIRVLGGHSHEVNSVSFNKDGSLLASSSYDNTVRIWDLKSEIHYVFNCRSDWMNSVSFSPDGKRLISGSADGVIFVWDVTNKEGNREPMKQYRLVNTLNLSGANFEKAIISKEDRAMIMETGARI